MKNNILISLSSLVVIIAGLKYSAPILTPFLLAIFITIIITPPLFWLYEKNIPKPLAMAILIVGVSLFGILITLFVGSSINTFTDNLPEYQANLKGQTAHLLTWLSSNGVEISNKTFFKYLNPSQAMDMVGVALSSLKLILTNTFFIIFTVIFMLIEATQLPLKLKYILRDSKVSVDSFSEFLKSVKDYLAIKTYVSLATAILVSIFLYILGVDFALLWGLVTFLLNYIPNIGSIMAAIPPILMALIQGNPTTAFIVAIGYIVINIVMGNIIEPKFMGDGLGISPLVVFLSLVFWGWILGATGMFLSIPLTIMIKIALSHNEKTEWISILLGNNSDLES